MSPGGDRLSWARSCNPRRTAVLVLGRLAGVVVESVKVLQMHYSSP